MCLLYALKILKRNGKVYHGTNKTGKWQIERLNTLALSRWFISQ